MERPDGWSTNFGLKAVGKRWRYRTATEYAGQVRDNRSWSGPAFVGARPAGSKN